MRRKYGCTTYLTKLLSILMKFNQFLINYNFIQDKKRESSIPGKLSRRNNSDDKKII